MPKLFHLLAAGAVSFGAALDGYLHPSFAQSDEGVFLIMVSYETRTQRGTSSGSSRGRNIYEERVIEATPDCTVKSFDIIDGSRKKRPLSEWQWPVEVEMCADEKPRLVNVAEMVARRDAFLAAADLPEEACGSHVFTWDVFRIECDPQEILQTLQEIDLGALNLTEGANYTHGTKSAPLKRVEENDGGHSLAASFRIDEEEVRKTEAQSKVIVGEVTGRPISEAEAAAEAQAIEATGETHITFALGERGEITRTVVMEAEIYDPESGSKTRYAKTITQRKRAGASSARPSI